MKIIKYPLIIGNKDIELYQDIYLDGKLVLSKRSDSLVSGFLRILYNFMGQAGLQYSRKGTFTITNCANNGSGLIRVTISGSGDNYTANNGMAQIEGVLGCTEANGRWLYNRVDNTHYDLQGSTFANSYISSGKIALTEPNTSWVGNSSFNAGWIFCGTSKRSVEIQDIDLWNPISAGSGAGQLTYGSLVVATDGNDSTTAQITMSQQVTNNSANPITIFETDLVLQNGVVVNRGGYMNLNSAVARDVIAEPGVTVNVGKTAVINYRIKTTMGENGGLLLWFIRLLFRQITNTTRAVTCTDGLTRSNVIDAAHFRVVCPGGTNRQAYSILNNDLLGLKVGRGADGTIANTNAVTITDYALHGQIVHGTGTNQLLHYGTFVQNYRETGTTKAEFDILSMYENKSGASIDITEFALYCLQSTDATVALVRKKLTDLTKVTLADNELLKVIITPTAEV